jgi:hypothetical protein
MQAASLLLLILDLDLAPQNLRSRIKIKIESGKCSLHERKTAAPAKLIGGGDSGFPIAGLCAVELDRSVFEREEKGSIDRQNTVDVEIIRPIEFRSGNVP